MLNVAIITLDSHLASAFARVNRELQGHGVNISLHSAGDWGRDQVSLEACHQAIADADIIVVTMLFMEEHVQAVLEPLQKKREHCDAIVCCMCTGDIVKLTRMGRFTMDGGDSRAKAFFKRLRKSKPPGKKASAGKMQMAMLRRVPGILRYIPGTAQDIRNYFLVLQYWLAGSDENACNLIRMLVSQYGNETRKLEYGDINFDSPREYIDIGLYHPELKDRITGSLASLPQRQQHGKEINAKLPDKVIAMKDGGHKKSRGRIGVLLMRSYVLAGNTLHYDAVIKKLESLGYDVIPAFASGLDARPAIERFYMQDGKPTIDALLSLTGFSLVGGPAYNDANAAEEILAALDIPYMAAMGLEFQTLDQWQQSDRGLLPVESAMMVAIPELDGATHSAVFGGRATPDDPQRLSEQPPDSPEQISQRKNGVDMYPHSERVERLCCRIDKLVSLRNTPRASRRVAMVIFNFPPNAGAIGTAAHLGVFESVFNSLKAMQQQGYTVDVPADVDALRHALLQGNAQDYGAEANVETVIPVDSHIRRETHLEEIEAAWGRAPGKHLTNGQGLFILGKSFGNVLVCVQPGFGYEGDPMRLLFEKSFAPTHAFSAFYRYLREDYAADAVVHFGTHGALEFMPGKQTGMSAECWPDRLIGDLPNYYLYAANNASEGTIAKRRAGATLISYLTPAVTHAGLYKGLLDLNATIDRWRSTPPDDACTRKELFELIGVQADELDFELDTISDPDNCVQHLRTQLLELQESLIPHGLHVIGDTLSEEQCEDMLTAVAKVESTQRGIEDSAINDKVKSLLALPEDQSAAFIESEKDPDQQALLSMVDRMSRSLQVDTELPALIHALDGTYTRPVVGGDVLRSPEILPTGRNLHGFDPFRMPSISALHRGALAAQNLIDRHINDGNPLPETMAMVLWGTDNLKTEGAPIAQVLSLMGAKPRFDNYGRLCGAELIDLDTLARPRIDVMVTLSGIFRDLLPQQTRLLAEAAWLAASADEPEHLNFIRKHTLQYMHDNNCDMETAALRVFSNADGAYGSNVNHLIDSGSWSDEAELADTFSNRKSFAYGRDGENAQQTQLFESILSRVEVATQNLDSVEIGVTSIDHYFDTLGGISRCVERASHKAPTIYISDDTIGKARVKTLAEQVELETRSRLLNPKWYGQMLEHGHEGVRHIEAHITNTLGWSATTGEVKPWVYEQLTDTFMLDESVRDRMAELNPEASMRMINRLFEAHERKYWQPDEETLATLQSVGEDLEDRMEGIVEGVHA